MKRRRLETHIYADDCGIAAVFTVNGIREETRFPHNTPLPEIRRHIEARQTFLSKLNPAVARGTLAALIAGYLKSVPASRRKDRAQLLQPWVDAVGAVSVYALTRKQLQDVAQGWLTKGLSASRVSKRISALRVAWASSAPDHALPHPIEKITRYRGPEATTTTAPLELIAKALDAFPPCASTARLKVLAWTGQPPARVMQIRKHHVRWHTNPPELYVVPRRKGTGSPEAWLPLLPQAVDALRELFRLKATGTFTLSPLGRFWERHVTALDWSSEEKAQLLALHPYSLRHSFLSAYGTLTQDIYAVAEYAGHRSLQTTRRYLRGAASARMTQGIAALSEAFPLPTGVTKNRGTERGESATGVETGGKAEKP